MYNSLAISVALKRSSVALQTANGDSCADIDQDSSARFVGEVDRFLKRHNLSQKDIRNLIVASGPGSFTGIRIGISFAKAMRELLDLNIITVSYFDVLEYYFKNEKSDNIVLVLSSENPKELYYKIPGSDAGTVPFEELDILLNNYNRIICEEDERIIENCKSKDIKTVSNVRKAIHLLNFVDRTGTDLKPFYVKPPYTEMKK